jgi:hypothetical protein
VPREEFAEAVWQTFIDDDPHAAVSFKLSFDLFEQQLDLLLGNSGKIFQKLPDGIAFLEAVEQILDGYARLSKDGASRPKRRGRG